MEAIIAAAITATASIVVAIIQAVSAHRQAAMLRQSVAPQTPAQPVERHQPPREIEETKPTVRAYPQPVGSRRTWLWVLAVLGGEAILLPILSEPAAFINILVFPIVTLVLSYWRPIPFGWAAVTVALLHGGNYLGYWLGGGTFSEEDLPISLVFYIANALLVSLVAILRSRTLRSRAA